MTDKKKIFIWLVMNVSNVCNCQLAMISVRQDGMVQTKRREDINFGDSKVMVVSWSSGLMMTSGCPMGYSQV